MLTVVVTRTVVSAIVGAGIDAVVSGAGIGIGAGTDGISTGDGATTVPGAVIIGIALLLVSICVLPFFIANYRVFQLSLALAYAIAILGLNMLMGFNGQISLGHGAFYAIGAYTAAILMDKGGVPYWATIPIAGLVCLVAGFLFGLPALRLEGLYLAIATLALGIAMPQILKHKVFE